MNESIDLEQCPVMVALYDDIGWNLDSPNQEMSAQNQILLEVHDGSGSFTCLDCFSPKVRRESETHFRYA